MTALSLWRMPRVREATGTGRAQTYADVADGLLPRPIHQGRMALWPSHEIEAIVLARIAGRDDQQIRELVAELMAARKDADKVRAA